eukprot:6179304-Prymnesium_polylepis.1
MTATGRRTQTGTHHRHPTRPETRAPFVSHRERSDRARFEGLTCTSKRVAAETGPKHTRLPHSRDTGASVAAAPQRRRRTSLRRSWSPNSCPR